ncbi:MAG TPA: NCS1 family nucleobase:cation symporter-1 [Blastocatellia bacterium]|nr:NCS1 family nucleobase:cation symporter-1 [Blastocatellia bacterium]
MAAETEAARATGRDFVELHEDVSASPLWNRDLAPTTIRERTWTTYNIAALWIGMSVVITTYTLAGGFIEQGMNWWQAMITILLGNTIVLVPMVLNAHAGTKYGISFPVLCRASFGTRGANIAAMARALVACGWFGIQTWIGGTALDGLMKAMWGGWANVTGHEFIMFGVFWLIQVVIIVRGIEGIKHLESWSAPLLLVGGAILLWWAVSEAGGLDRVLSPETVADMRRRIIESDPTKTLTPPSPFWEIFPAALTASVGYWATLSLNIPDFTRYARSQRSQMLGQALGLPTTMTAFAFIGVATTSATVLIFDRPIPDPVELVGQFDSLAIVLFATVVIFAAQLTTNMAANVVSPSNDFSNLSPRHISYVTGGLITAAIGVLMMPWYLYRNAGAYIFTWLIGYSGLMGAIAGILICDYWVIRKQKLSLKDLFMENGLYSYASGFNWRAVAAFVIAIAPVVPGFLRAATTPGGKVENPNAADTIYTYAWFVTFGLAFVIYLALMWKKRVMQYEAR